RDRPSPPRPHQQRDQRQPGALVEQRHREHRQPACLQTAQEVAHSPTDAGAERQDDGEHATWPPRSSRGRPVVVRAGPALREPAPRGAPHPPAADAPPRLAGRPPPRPISLRAARAVGSPLPAPPPGQPLSRAPPASAASAQPRAGPAVPRARNSASLRRAPCGAAGRCERAFRTVARGLCYPRPERTDSQGAAAMSVFAPSSAPTEPFVPSPLRSLADTGLSESFLSDLILKVLHFGGNASGAELSRRVRLPYLEILDPLVAAHRKQQFIEVRGGVSTLAAGYEYALTERGRARAVELAERSRYAGPAPVPMAQYRASVKAQTVRNTRITRQDLEVAFSDLVLPKRVLDQVGPA